MLVITRRIRERVFIGENVEVEVLEVSAGGRVRLGITAPKEMLVTRGELYSINSSPAKKLELNHEFDSALVCFYCGETEEKLNQVQPGLGDPGNWPCPARK